MSTPQVKMMPLGQLKPNKRNARTHSKNQIRQIANLIRRYGWTYPILIDENGNIVAGHGRCAAAALLGLRDVPVLVMSGLSDAEKRAFALADNKVAANAGYDRAVLAAELGELALLLPECELSIDITGFEPAEIDTLLGEFFDPEFDPADEIPSVERPAVSELGDLWELDTHRLLCGDSLAAPEIRKQMGAELAGMVIADAPYNVKIKNVQGRGRIKHREFVQASGEMSPAQFTEFLRISMSLAAKHSRNGSIQFWFMDWRHTNEIFLAGSKVYPELKNIIVWVKTNAGQGTFYRSRVIVLALLQNLGVRPFLSFAFTCPSRNSAMTWETPVPPNSCPETTAYLRRANADYFVSGRRVASTRERKGPKISADSSLGEEQIRSQANILKPGGGSGIHFKALTY